jgi:hypothetical protein
MISKNHRQNTNFQITHFLAGSCHTPDGAYFLLQDLREERQLAVENYLVSKVRTEAKIIRIKRTLDSVDEADRLEAEADMQEIENNVRTGAILYQAACDEIAFIDNCLEKLNEHRKYKGLPDTEACQAMQYDEWLLELIHRAENFLATQGTIPADEFNTMRMHPAFSSEILPKINEIRAGMQAGSLPFLTETGPLTKLLTQ